MAEELQKLTLTAIDPGPEESALVRWDGNRILQAAITDNWTTLMMVQDTEGPLFVEMIACYGMAVGAETFETCVWIGRFVQAYDNQTRSASRIVRGKVKMHHCHAMKATDSNIRQALIDRFGKPGTKKAPGATFGLKADLWQAFALAVYAWDTCQQEKAPCVGDRGLGGRGGGVGLKLK